MGTCAATVRGLCQQLAQPVDAVSNDSAHGLHQKAANTYKADPERVCQPAQICAGPADATQTQWQLGFFCQRGAYAVGNVLAFECHSVLSVLHQ